MTAGAYALRDGVTLRFVPWVLGLQPWRVVATFVAAQWALVLGLALVVRHNGWVY